MKMFGCPKREFFTSKARLNFEVYCQRDKITPEAGKKPPPYSQFAIKISRVENISLKEFGLVVHYEKTFSSTCLDFYHVLCCLSHKSSQTPFFTLGQKYCVTSSIV